MIAVQKHTYTNSNTTKNVYTNMRSSKTMTVKLEIDSVNINGVSVVHQIPHLVMVWCLWEQSHVEHWSLGSLDFPLTLHSL